VSSNEPRRTFRSSFVANRATTIVLITACVSADLEQRGKAAGADQVLSKPFSFDQLEAIVRKTLG
jgi:DNA-binding response OmpR family regulator